MQISADAADDQIFIRGPKPQPYVDPCALACPMCDNTVPRWMRFLRSLFALPSVSAADIVWCPGGKPPSERREGLEAIVMGEQREFSCAGIPVPHLHCRCSRCEYMWIMATTRD